MSIIGNSKYIIKCFYKSSIIISINISWIDIHLLRNTCFNQSHYPCLFINNREYIRFTVNVLNFIYFMQVKKGRGPQNARRIFMKILDSIFFVILFKTKNEIFSFLIEYFLYLLAMLFFRLIKICTSFKWPWLSSLLKTIILHPTIMCKCSYPYLLFFQRFHLQKWKYYYNKNRRKINITFTWIPNSLLKY